MRGGVGDFLRRGSVRKRWWQILTWNKDEGICGGGGLVMVEFGLVLRSSGFKFAFGVLGLGFAWYWIWNRN